MVDEKVLPKGGLGKITEELEPVFYARSDVNCSSQAEHRIKLYIVFQS